MQSIAVFNGLVAVKDCYNSRVKLLRWNAARKELQFVRHYTFETGSFPRGAFLTAQPLFASFVNLECLKVHSIFNSKVLQTIKSPQDPDDEDSCMSDLCMYLVDLRYSDDKGSNTVAQIRLRSKAVEERAVKRDTKPAGARSIL